MRISGLCLLLTGASLLLTGCGTQFGGSSVSSNNGGLAVVDLDKVAGETGKDIQMKEIYQVQENNVKQQLAKAQYSANSQFEEKKKEYGDNPTDEQKKDLVQFQYNATNVLGKLQNQAGTKLGQYRQDQVAKFRTEIKPIAQEVAAKRGLSVVIPKNDGLLLAVDPGVDITEAVIKAYREKRPAPTAVPVAATPSAAKQPAAAPARTATREVEAEESTK